MRDYSTLERYREAARFLERNILKATDELMLDGYQQFLGRAREMPELYVTYLQKVINDKLIELQLYKLL